MKVNKLFAVLIPLVVVAAMGMMLFLDTQPRAVQADGPGAPTGLTARASWLPRVVNAEGITLNWTAPAGTVTGYQISKQRSECDDALAVYVENTGTSSTTYADTDVVDGVEYVYEVKAINADGIGAEAASVAYTYSAPPWSWAGDIGGTKKPTSLEIWNTTNGLQLQWEAPDSTSLTGYHILRRRPEQCEAFHVHLASTESTKTHWIDTDVEIGTLYDYRIAGINSSGTGKRSDPTDHRRLKKSHWAPGTLYVFDSRYTLEKSRTSATMGVERLEIDDDPETVDYTWRGDVTLASDGSDADECEGTGLGVDRELTVVDSQTTQFEFTFGGAACRVGHYTIPYVVHDRNGNEERSSRMTREVIGITMDGKAQVGETLSADVSTIRNHRSDFFADATFTYKWYTSDGNSYAAIQGATSSTYTVVAGDVGKTIRVGNGVHQHI